MNAADRSPEELWVCHLGVVPYRHALATQERVRALRQTGELPDTLLLLEHPPVYTRGRRSGAEDLPLGERFYRAKGIDVVDVDRGGRLTYHSPGQLVGYPIMRIDDVHRYLRTMEHAIVAALAGAGVHARSRHDEGIDYTGVWVHDRKIASIGVHVSRGVTTHGFAVNVDNDLEPFSWVVACGLPDVAMTSLQRESAGECDALSCLRKRIAHAFCQAHGRRQRLVSPARLGIDTAHAPSIKTISSPVVEPVPA
ncbi:MAG TPA: lipoyl(octanoyl) transferase LipB [Solirubrobacteraceae bacterium]|jgi:lipoyl(octanoyl) transferase|nr:lipoyl(octanoyl) transferase LipB [Solirubrobacteraceae bacterium]